ncbi:MAG: hypothetical protein V4732_00820 [Pseudomonadota bacterium]
MAATKAVTTEVIRPEIINTSISAHSLDLTLNVTENLCYFAAHFPDFPVLPGVVQLSWAVNYAREFLGLNAPVMNIERLKFTCPIQPNTKIILHIDYDGKKNSAAFCFHALPFLSFQAQAGAQEPLIFSQGRLLYARADQ